MASNFWRTLRFRFAAWIAILLCMILIAFGLFVYTTLRQSLMDSIDDRLEVFATQAQAIVTMQGTTLDRSQSDEVDLFLSNLEEQDITFHLYDPAGESVFAFGYDNPLAHDFDQLARSSAGLISEKPDPGEPEDMLRVYAASVVVDGQLIGFIELTHTLETLEDTLDRLLLYLEIGIPLFTIGAGIGGYMLVARALGRIDRITDTARRISSEDLSARLELPDIDDEVGRLSKTFDMMLDRLEISFNRERQFANDAAHELRTPLTAMRTILDTTRAKRRPTERYEEAMDDLTGEVNRLQRLVDDLLNLVRNQSSSTLNLETVHLSDVLDDLCESLSPLAQVKGLKLNCTVPDDLRVIADFDHIIRLFFNLIDNAINYTDEGEITIEAKQVNSDSIEVSISDTGKGIAPEHIPHIFDRFYRVEASRTSNGTGLGLSIAKKIAEAHDGTLTVKSTIGQGSVFTVYLPLTPQDASHREE